MVDHGKRVVALVRLALVCVAFGFFGGCSNDDPGRDEPPGECVPSCEGKSCGSDGCTGTCGGCDDGGVCGPEGTCVSDFDPTGSPDVPPELIETGPVGTAPGQLAVSHLGQAQYSVPLSLPPGRAGLMPALALRYDSAAPNSYLGQGWRLDGISVIARCSRTLAQDGRAIGVRYSGDDAFCLDGVRLAPLRDAPDEYRTELDQIARVTARRSPQSGVIESWTVWRRDGFIHRFTARAIPASIGGEDDFWLLTRLEDRSGNFAVYEYTIGATSSVSGRGVSIIPRRISYAGHASGMPPDIAIDFLTEAREDPRTAHHAGWYLESSQLVSTIRVSLTNQVLREYRLSYDFARPDHSASLLSKLSECVPKLPGTQELVCKPPTRFLYDNTPAGLGAPQQFFKYHGTNSADNVGDVVLDMDGDGRDDLLVPVPGKGDDGLWHQHWEIVWGKDTASGTAVPQNTGQSLRGPHNDPRLYNVLDWDGDGRDDLLMEPKFGAAKYWVLSYKKGSFVIDKTSFTSATLPGGDWAGRTYVLDADGDGLRDLVRCMGPAKGPWKWALIAAPQGVVERPIDFGGFCFQHYAAIDLDGDGSQELMMQYFDTPKLQHKTYRAIRFVNANPDGATPTTPVKVESIHTSIPVDVSVGRSARPMDVNGDGLTDLVDIHGPSYGPQTFDVYVNTGAATTPGAFNHVSSQSLEPPKGSRFRPGPVIDEDADGRDDLMVMAPGEGWMVLRSAYDKGAPTAGVPAGFSLHSLVHPIPFTSDPRGQAMDLDGDGVKDFVAKHGAGHSWMHAHLRRGEAAPRVTDIVDGMGQHTQIEYAPLIEPAVYTHASEETGDLSCGGGYRNCRFPHQRVVRKLHAYQGAKLAGVPVRTFLHHYQASKIGRRGRGWLGFGSRTVTEPGRGASQTFEFDNVTADYDLWDYPFAGLVKRHVLEERTEANRSLRTTTSYTWKTVRHASARAHFPYVAAVVALREELTPSAKTELGKATHSISVDAFHNVRRITSKFGGGESATQDAQYEHDATPSFLDAWLIALPTEVTHTSSASGVVQSTQTRRWRLRHLANGALETVASEPDDPSLMHETLFVRDAFGNPIKIRQYSKAKTRQRTIAYEGRGVFPRVVVDEEGYKTEIDFHHGHGLPVRVREHGKAGQASAALEHLSVADGFGRPRLMVGPDGTQARRAYEPVSGPFNPMVVTTEVPGWARSVVRIDPLGRQVGETFSTFNGVELDYFQRYNVYGRPFDVIRPTSGKSAVKTKFEHDDAGRLLAITHPDATKQVYCYRGNVSCMKDARGFVRCAARDGRGRIRSVWDPMPSDKPRACDAVAAALASGAEQRPSVRYGFGPHGLLDRVDDSQGNTTFIGRDVLGRVFLRYDPGTGIRSFSYGAFSNLQSETDARGVTTSYGYDLLDRTVVRTDPAGSTHFNWSNALHGSLDSTSTPDGVQASLEYDSSGRLKAETRKIGTVLLQAGIDERDQYGRPTIVAYPSASGQPALRVRFTYDAHGNAIQVANADSGEVYWKLGAIDEFGQVTEEKLGVALTTQRKHDQPFGRVELEETTAASAIHTRKYSYDAVGNVHTTGAPQASKQLTFEYDELNRLAKETNGGSVAYEYSPGGNLVDKPGVGTYAYTLPLRPHAVAAVTSGASTQGYGYDAAGNLTSRTGAPLAPLTLDYTSFDKPFRIFSSSPADGTELGYDADQVRARKQRPGEVTTYFPGMYTGTAQAGGTDERFWIYAGGRPIAELIRDSSGERLTYLLADRLGSIEAIADPQGSVLERRTFDSFGQKQVLSSAAGYLPTRLGFGGHESDDEHGLVNMGGRIYDPRLGRFTSADPLVPTADSQGWNRYSFVLNNPATLTDPSGFDPACDNLSPLCSSYGGSTPGGGDGGQAVSDIIRMNTVSVYHSGFAGTDASSLAATPPNGTLPGFGDMVIVGIVEPLGSVQSSPLFEPGPLVSTPGAAWFGIDAFNNPSGDWPRRGGTVPYSALDSEVFVPGLRDLLNPRASVGERMFGGVTLGMTVLPGAGVAIRWVAVAARATGAFRVAGAVARGGAGFWRGVAKGGGETVTLYHGSVSNYRGILRGGLDASRAPTWVTTSRVGAQNAIGPGRVLSPGQGLDAGIVKSTVSKTEFDALINSGGISGTRTWPGFGGGQVFPENVLRSPEAIELFNRGILRP